MVLLQARIFSGMGAFQDLVFQGAVTSKLLRFSVTQDGVARILYLASVISAEEKPAWQAFQDVLDFSVKSAASGMLGIFGLDILSADIQNGIQHFNTQDFSTLLINHGRRLQVGQRAVIRYDQVFCLLHKRVAADWGKIEVASHVEIVNPGKTRLLGFLKRIIGAAGQEKGIYLIHDLGLIPAWELEQEMQDKKLCDFLQQNPGNIYFYRTEGQLRDILVQGCHPRESGGPAESKANSAGFPLSRG